MGEVQRTTTGVMRLALCEILYSPHNKTLARKQGYVFVTVSVFTLNTKPLAVGSISTSSLDIFCSMRVISEVAEGFVAVSNVKLAGVSAIETFEIGTKASAALGD